ncbi:shikimate dehydrogenase [Enterococcus avium]|uniref:shikimate dehydrogenase n=1 Tax=Enterococcus malodoratus TaxID=71451 RepID=UPI0008BE8898|nr:shikimate dehydrogenase [Enterococcus malodoratus]BBM19114.1 shikimate dehydrogenase [Enterococcus avium]SES83424.1 shikimate dehydrogenase [Enterococcus malodoratus]
MLEGVSGKTQLYGLIGSPVGHSGSPAMYNYGFEQLGIDAVYLAFDVQIEEVEKAFQSVRTFNMPGGNVTMPCKGEAAKYMDELSPAAQMVGAINTFQNKDGKLSGHITDGIGFVDNLKNHGVDPKNKKFVVLGTGGAATAIQVQLAIEEAASIDIFNIKDDFFVKGKETVERIKKFYPDLNVAIHDLLDANLLKSKLAEADVLVNGTTVGMGVGSTKTPISDTSVLHKELIVADAIYNPPKTQLIKDADEKGCTTVTGEGMLLGQGKAAFEIFTGQALPTREN